VASPLGSECTFSPADSDSVPLTGENGGFCDSVSASETDLSKLRASEVADFLLYVSVIRKVCLIL